MQMRSRHLGPRNYLDPGLMRNPRRSGRGDCEDKKEEKREGKKGRGRRRGGEKKKRRTFSPGSRLESLANQRRRETRLIFGD